MRIEDLDAQIFNTMIRQAGWHFMWTQESCAKRGLGASHAGAIERALIHALDAVSLHFNAAELSSVQVTKYFGFHLATVTVESRQIQQETSPEFPNDL